MGERDKRKEPPTGDSSATKKAKTKKKWAVPRKGGREEAKIETGDAGIWATCNKGQEGKCVRELKSLFQEYVDKFYGDSLNTAENAQSGSGGEDEAVDIESEIKDEVSEMKTPAKEPPFRNIWIDIQCVIFMKTRPPIEPVTFIHAICKDAMASRIKKTRFLKRLTPVTLVGKATETGLEDVAKKVLEPHFHAAEGGSKSFAIRPTIRNHDKSLTRDSIIKQVADLVGSQHKVDLGNPDLVILVEVYRNHCGMSVVDGEYEKLKRYNISEICEPTESVET